MMRRDSASTVTTKASVASIKEDIEFLEQNSAAFLQDADYGSDIECTGSKNIGTTNDVIVIDSSPAPIPVTLDNDRAASPVVNIDPPKITNPAPDTLVTPSRPKPKARPKMRLPSSSPEIVDNPDANDHSPASLKPASPNIQRVQPLPTPLIPPSSPLTDIDITPKGSKPTDAPPAYSITDKLTPKSKAALTAIEDVVAAEHGKTSATAGRDLVGEEEDDSDHIKMSKKYLEDVLKECGMLGLLNDYEKFERLRNAVEEVSLMYHY